MPKIEHYTTTLEKIFYLTPTVRTFRFRFPGKGFSFQPGQFCMVEVPAGDKINKKAYSIASSPYDGDYLDLCIKLVAGGLATTWFWTFKKVHGLRREEESYADAFAGRLLYMIGHKPDGLLRHLKEHDCGSAKYYEFEIRKAIIIAAFNAQIRQQETASKIFAPSGERHPLGGRLIAVA